MNYNNFHIELLEDENLLVVPTNYLRPDFYIEQIEDLLISTFPRVNFIYFDFLVKNGTKDRFYKVNISNNRLSLDSMCKVEITQNLESKSNSFFANNIYLINESFLSKSQKFLLKKKLLV